MGAKLPGKLLSLLIILKVFGSTEASCSLADSYADCRSQNLDSVPHNLPTGITNLDLRYNHITTISQSDFSRYVNLTRLDLRSNHIATISTRAFYRLSNLVTLSLHVNSLSNLSADMFTGLGNLQYLHLRYNEISDIQAGTFNSTPQLTTLSLNNNTLTTLRFDMFTGLGNLQHLYLDNNEISDIQAGTFNSTPQLTILYLHTNKLTTLRSDMFTGLGNLQDLRLYNNEISDIQAGTFNSTPQLRYLFLQYNRLTVLKAEIFTKLSSFFVVYINNNPWQCDCKMVPFRQKMNGSHPFEDLITCEGPRNLRGQKLKDISPEDLVCEELTIARFERVHNYTVVEGESLYLVCEASGIPTRDITVILPSGLSANVESGGRVTVGVNGAITITNVTAATDAGLYVCIATSPVGSAFAVLVVNVQQKTTTTCTVTQVTSPVTTFKTESSSSYHESVPGFSISVPVFIGSVCATVAGTVLIGGIIFTIWHMRKTQKPSSDPALPVVFSNTSAMVTISDHDQTGQGGDQATSETFDNARSSELVPGHLEYEEVVFPPRNVNTSSNSAGLIQQPTEYQILGPNRNRAASDELPPLPPPSNRNNGGPTGAHGTPHYYQSLKKKT